MKQFKACLVILPIVVVVFAASLGALISYASGSNVKKQDKPVSALGVIIIPKDCPYAGGYNFGTILNGYAKESGLYVSKEEIPVNGDYKLNVSNPITFNDDFSLLHQIENTASFHIDAILDSSGNTVGILLKEE